jgi:hypothetical protein
MFNKRIIADVKLAKTPKNEDIDEEIAEVVGQSATNIINGVIEDCLRPAAKIIVGSIVTVAVVSAVCKIAVKTTPTR